MTNTMKLDLEEAKIRLREATKSFPDHESREVAYTLALNAYMAGYKHALEAVKQEYDETV